MGCVGHVARIWGDKWPIENFAGKAEKKRQVGGPRCRWESNIRTKL